MARATIAGTERGFLARLRDDVRGNTIAMLAAMLVPLCAFSGSAIDMARLYVVKARLQQACDAGVLAGRKFMDTTQTTLDTNAAQQAQNFFANNFKLGFFQTTVVPPVNGVQPLTFTPTKTSDNQVYGTAQVVVPMTIMRMFGFAPKTMVVTCEARYDVADADIMFVLDTTGSMACLTSDSQSTCDSYASNTGNLNQDSQGYYVTEKTNSRISGVRSAVLNFFDQVTGQADATTNFRFGFVPYSATVNVGKLLQPLGYMASSWTYQSREVYGDANSGNPSTSTDSSKTNAYACNNTTPVRSPATAKTYSSSGTATLTSWSWSNGSCTKSVQTLIPNWQYKPETYNVSQYVAGNTVDNPAQVDSSTSKWPGCIEERATTATASFSTTAPPLDLDVDTAPSGSLAGSYWGPMWLDVEFARLSTNETSSASRTVTARPYGSNMYESYAVITNEIPCPVGASRLSSMQLQGGSSSSAKSALRTQIQNYLSASSGFRPYGVTYHDVGMTWGTRLLSPNGMFANDTAAWSGHNPPNRYIIFLTDGTMETDPYAYASHGIENYDGRVTGGSTSNLTAYHNTRFTTACTIAKNHNITIFVIAFAQTLTTQLTACASPNQAYYASDTTGLNTAFGQIAKQVAMLRLDK